MKTKKQSINRSKWTIGSQIIDDVAPKILNKQEYNGYENKKKEDGSGDDQSILGNKCILQDTS